MMTVTRAKLAIWRDAHYHVYVMASRSRVLYVGVTNDLPRRVDEHKRGLTPGFTSRYRVSRLVYFEEFADIRDASAREKELKGWRRSRKLELVDDRNPMWKDLAETWFHPFSVPKGDRRMSS